ncbi:MAG: single-stranded-DNA-specific exonuclease RecJ [Gammaproteobacteria bacterium]
MIPSPIIQSRTIDIEKERKAREAGLDPVIARILAARPVQGNLAWPAFLNPKLNNLDPPHHLADLSKAVARVMTAIKEKQVIGLETDHDCDGQTSHAVLYSSLVDYFQVPGNLVKTYIGHRLEEGYGLSESLCDRILADSERPQLIITADNGSTDETQIARLKAQGIDVIVTDHHEIPKEGIPQSALAVLNPTREDCNYPDRMIAGCMVAWLFMAAVRTQLIDQGCLPKTTPSLAGLLDFVAVGTIADCVSMARSLNNRAVVQYGLKCIQTSQRPCWQAVRTLITNDIRAEDIGFRIGPLLNADGRLDDALGSVSFLLAQNLETAMRWIGHLIEQNDTRKSIQDTMMRAAIPLAREQCAAKQLSICLYLEAGHPGVHGIAASRIKDLFGRPTIIFSPKYQSAEIITGSARGIDGIFHLRDALQHVADEYPNLIIKFGGHKGAAGLTIRHQDLALFQRAFEHAVSCQLDDKAIGPVVLTDGVLPPSCFNVESILKLNILEPFGREFEAPVFETIAEVLGVTILGQEQVHAKVRLKVQYTLMDAIWFRCRTDATEPIPVDVGETIKIAFIPKINEYRGVVTFSPQIVAMEKCHGSL